MSIVSSASDRVTFLKMATLFQGGLLLLAVAASWWLGEPVWKKCHLTLNGIAWGVIATVPMLIFLVVVYQSRARSLVQIRELLRETLGKSLSDCGWLDLSLIALLAGFSEEFLFRGVLEPWLSGNGPVFGLVACNVIFGICHAVTPAYAVLAGIMGAYLSSTRLWTGESNLIVPVCSHALYDLVAFAVVRNSFRRVSDTNHQDREVPPTLAT